MGFNLLVPESTSEAGKKEHKFLESYGMNKSKFQLFQEYKLFGIRRKLRTRPQQTKHHFDGDDLVIKFSLAAGEYASVLIDSLLQQLG